MTVALWILQAILAIKLISVTLSHGLRQDQETMDQAITKMGGSARLGHALVAIFAFIAAAGLILPGLLKLWPQLTVWAAALAVLLMIGSIFFHVKFRDKPNVFVSLILLALAVFAAYGRWALAPF
jgi:uncharacterized membrane protein YphA (DoxX/SURF4 family)